MNVKTHLRTEDEVSCVLEVEVSAENVNQAWDATIRQLQQKVALPGFRRGRVPRSVLERRFAASVRDDVKARLVEESLPVALAEQPKQVAAWELLENSDVTYGGTFRYTARLEFWPRFGEVRWRGLVLTRRQPSISEEDVDRRLGQLRESHGVLEPAAEDHVIEPNDVVLVEVEPSGGRSGGANKQRVWVDLTSRDEQVQTLAPLLIGRRKGEVVPLDRRGENAAERQMVLCHVYRKVLPELDDEFASSVSGASTLAELREILQKQLEEEMRRRSESALRTSAIEALIALNEPIILPPSVVQQEAYRQAKRELRRAGLSADAAERVWSERHEELFDTFRAVAERELKTALLLSAVADQEGVQVTDEELQKELERQLDEIEDDRWEVRKWLESKTQRDRLREALRRQKVVDLILREAQVVEA